MQNKLSAKIKAVNRVNAYIKANAPAILEALKPFVGKKVTLATGELAAKVKDALAPFFEQARTNGLTVYRNSSRYSFSLVFKVSENCDSYGCVYHEASVYFLDLASDSGMATKAYEFNPENFKSDHDEVSILLTQKELEIAREEVRRLESKLGAFLEVR
jgi:hypothetical protein